MDADHNLDVMECGSPSTLPIASLILNRQWMKQSLKRSMHVGETCGVNV
jgi:hypothetical protein